MKKALITLICAFLILGIVGTGTANFQYGYNSFMQVADRLNNVLQPVIQLLMPTRATTGIEYSISFYDVETHDVFAIKVELLTPTLGAQVETIPNTFGAPSSVLARGYVVTENTSNNDDFSVGSYVFYANPASDQSYSTYLRPFVRILGLSWTKPSLLRKYYTLYNSHNLPAITGG